MTVHVYTMNTKQEYPMLTSTFSYVYICSPIMLYKIVPGPYYQHLVYTLLLAACYRRVLCFKQEDRLETEGTPVPVSRLSLHLTVTCVFMFSSIPFPSWPTPPSTLSPCRPTSMCFSITARLTNTWRHTQSGHIGISPPLRAICTDAIIKFAM